MIQSEKTMADSTVDLVPSKKFIQATIGYKKTSLKKRAIVLKGYSFYVSIIQEYIIVFF